MGIPRFYRWLSERYPVINENITAEQIPEFDNLYLDMNGIIHNCSHNNTGGLCMKSEDDVFVEAFKYITRLCYLIRPKKLLYMAVDGCAPRAKMNQQRSRRFRAANDAREAREKAAEMGEPVSENPFDSNCITPGTEFMNLLTEHLRFFVAKQMQEDPVWQDITVVLSGPDVPGEGEHKIMDYIRTSKAQPGYASNMRHCLYGLDADLIMLALASHEPHFALLREEVVFGRRTTENVEQRMLISKDRFQLLHVSLLREYLDLEFSPPKEVSPPYKHNLERVIDDFILFCILVGNDFLPHIPLAEIGEGGLDDFFKVYKEHLTNAETGDPWLTSGCGEIVFPQLAKFLTKYAQIEEHRLQCMVDDVQFILGKRRVVGPAHIPHPETSSLASLLDAPPTTEDARAHFYDVKFDIDINEYSGTQQQKQLFKSYLEGLQWVLFYYYRGPDGASWSWYYPYYHAPMISDLILYSGIVQPDINFSVGEPFKPFQQLMGVLPSNSKTFLPKCYQWLFDSPESPILSFYPQKFEVDVDFVKVPWGGVTLIPWIDPSALLEAMALAEQKGPPLSEAEKKRNTIGKARSFRFDSKQSASLCSSMPGKFKDIQRLRVRISDFRHPAMPTGMAHFLNDLPPRCDLRAPGFPTLAIHPITCTWDTGIKVFQAEARGKSLILHLHPEVPMIPAEDALQHLLKMGQVQIDFPFVHYGKVEAIHLPRTKLLSNGRTAHNEPRNHERMVRLLLQDWRKRGVTVDFAAGMSAGDAAAGRARRTQNGGPPEEESWLQPVAEVRSMESSYVDADGKVHVKYSSSVEYRLLHMIRQQEQAIQQRPRSISERFPVGAKVICVAPETEVFGLTGTIENNAGDHNTVEAKFEHWLSRAEQADLQKNIMRTVKWEHTNLKWHDLSSAAQQAGLEVQVVSKVFGSLMARCAENVREDLGMNLMCEAKGSATALCLPCYSIKMSSGWMFSDLAVEALKDYSSKFPTLFSAIKRKLGDDRDLEARIIFPDSIDIDYDARKLVKYCNGCAFKKLRLTPGSYMALPPSAIAEVAKMVDAACRTLDGQPVREEIIRGVRNFYKTDDAGARFPPDLPYVQDLYVGARGICVKPYGKVPAGNRGTVIGIYGKGLSAELEVLLDEDSFGACDLHGRAPSMRGLQVPASAFMAFADVSVCSRGVYAKPCGRVPVGSRGTAVGVSGKGPSAELEVVLDDENLSGSDPHGRIQQVPASAFLVNSAPEAGEGASELGGSRETVDEPRRGETRESRDQANNLKEQSAVLLNLLKSPQQGPAPEPVNPPELPRPAVIPSPKLSHQTTPQQFYSDGNALNTSPASRTEASPCHGVSASSLAAPPGSTTDRIMKGMAKRLQQKGLEAGRTASSPSKPSQAEEEVKFTGQSCKLTPEKPPPDAMPLPTFGQGSQKQPKKDRGPPPSELTLLGSESPGGATSSTAAANAPTNAATNSGPSNAASGNAGHASQGGEALLNILKKGSTSGAGTATGPTTSAKTSSKPVRGGGHNSVEASSTASLGSASKTGGGANRTPIDWGKQFDDLLGLGSKNKS